MIPVNTNDFYANDFAGIPAALAQNEELRKAVLALVPTQPMAGKATEGGTRLQDFRLILADLVEGRLDLERASERTLRELPRASSLHGDSNRVFASGWAERLVRTQYSRFYNQAVLQALLAHGETSCFVPHSSDEDGGSKCSRLLAGAHHSVQTLYDRLVQSYAAGNFGQDAKIPDHPHCTHVVRPSQSAS